MTDMSMQRTLKQSQIDALEAFLSAWDVKSCTEAGKTLPCRHVEALAGLLEAFHSPGRAILANVLRRSHGFCIWQKEDPNAETEAPLPYSQPDMGLPDRI